jgi:hypothetical protein
MELSKGVTAGTIAKKSVTVVLGDSKRDYTYFIGEPNQAVWVK